MYSNTYGQVIFHHQFLSKKYLTLGYMDQAFSLKNLKILLSEDRDKGGTLEEKYIPDAYKIRIKIFKLKKSESFLRHKVRSGKISADVYARRITRLNPVLEKRKFQHESSVIDELQNIVRDVNKKEFRLNISLLPSLVLGKKVYGVGKTLAEILAVRFIQKSLKVIHDIKMPSRDMLVSQVKSLTLDGVPKFIIRADVEQFYESVEHNHLLDVIHQSPQLSIVVKRMLTRLIKDYVTVSGDKRGLPRGIGVSAYLAEIYLSSIDEDIRKKEELFYYARYVDDMILMFAPQRQANVSNYMEFLNDILKAKGLALNHKTVLVDAVKEQKGHFEYLGYIFTLTPGNSGVKLRSYP